MEQPQPTSIGRYKILSVIGRDGMGVVYLAQDTLIERKVTIEVVAEELSGDAIVLEQLYCDFRKIENLNHPNILEVYDIGEQDGHFYVVMQFNEGLTCAEMIRGEQHLSLIQSIDIIRQVCAALGYAHRNGILHGDVRPSHVMVRKDGNAQLLDFGFSRHMFSRGLLTGGLVAYLAPERLKGESYDGRSDIFAAGVVLFQLLTGSLPFGGPRLDLKYFMQLLNEKHLPLSRFLAEYPMKLDRILDRSLAKEPADRYRTAEEMATDLCSAIETLKRQARPK